MSRQQKAWAYVRNVLSIGGARLPEFVLVVSIARLLGATATVDVLFLILASYAFLGSMLAVVFETVAVPSLARTPERLLRHVFLRLHMRGIFAGGACAALLVCGVAIACIGEATEGVNGSVCRAGLILSLGLLCRGSSCVGGALLIARSESYIVLLAGGLPALVALCALVAPYEVSITHFAVGLALGEVLRAAVLLLRGLWRIRDYGIAVGYVGDLKAFSRQSMYQLAGAIVLGVVPIVDRSLAYSVGEGAASLIAYSDRIVQAPIGLALGAFLYIALPEWSRCAEHGDGIVEVRRSIRGILRVCFLIMMCVLPLVWVFRTSLAQVLFGPAVLSSTSHGMAGAILVIQCVAGALTVVGMVLGRALLAFRRAEVTCGVICLQVGIKACCLLATIKSFGLYAIVGSNVVMYGASGLLMWWAVRRTEAAQVAG